MNERRMTKSCPNAKRSSSGFIVNYKLAFGPYHSDQWNGYVATIVPTRGQTVWGSIWEIPNNEILELDRQEAVYANIYNTIYVPVRTLDNRIIYCYTYQLTEVPVDDTCLPSASYLDVILIGAMEAYLPVPYIRSLHRIEDNGQYSVNPYPSVK